MESSVMQKNKNARICGYRVPISLLSFSSYFFLRSFSRSFPCEILNVSSYFDEWKEKKKKYGVIKVKRQKQIDYLGDIICQNVSFTGESVSSVDMSPILIGLGGTATGLGLIVTGVLMALWRRHAATPTKPKPLQQSSIATFTSKAEEEDGNPDLIPTTALSHHVTGNFLSFL